MFEKPEVPFHEASPRNIEVTPSYQEIVFYDNYYTCRICCFLVWHMFSCCLDVVEHIDRRCQHKEATLSCVSYHLWGVWTTRQLLKVSAFLKEWWDLLRAHSTAYKFEDYPGPGCGYSAWCVEVYGCLWERVKVRDRKRGWALVHSQGVCKQPCVQHSAAGCESLRQKLYGFTLSSFCYSHMYLPEFIMPSGFIGFMSGSVTDLLTWV